MGGGGKGEKGLKEEMKGTRGGGVKAKKRHRCEKGREEVEGGGAGKEAERGSSPRGRHY